MVTAAQSCTQPKLSSGLKLLFFLNNNYVFVAYFCIFSALCIYNFNHITQQTSDNILCITSDKSHLLVARYH